MKARAFLAALLPQPCGKCGEAVMPGEEFVVGHILSRRQYPEKTWEPSNWAPEHKRCSARTGQQVRLEAEDAEAEQIHREVGYLIAMVYTRLGQGTTAEAADYRRRAAAVAAGYQLDTKVLARFQSAA